VWRTVGLVAIATNNFEAKMADEEDVLKFRLSDLFNVSDGEQVIIPRSMVILGRRLLSDGDREQMDRECEDLSAEFVRISLTTYHRILAALACALDE
jgi:hypothetical protein